MQTNKPSGPHRSAPLIPHCTHQSIVERASVSALYHEADDKVGEGMSAEVEVNMYSFKGEGLIQLMSLISDAVSPPTNIRRKEYMSFFRPERSLEDKLYDALWFHHFGYKDDAYKILRQIATVVSIGKECNDEKEIDKGEPSSDGNPEEERGAGARSTEGHDNA